MRSEQSPEAWAQRLPTYLHEIKALGITVKPPSINKSMEDFTIVNDEIVWSLKALKGVGENAINYIVEARGNNYKSVWDFLERVNRSKINTKVFRTLVLAGCFDNLGYCRTELSERTEELYEYLDLQKKINEKTEQAFVIAQENEKKEERKKEIDDKVKAAKEKHKKKLELSEEDSYYLERADNLSTIKNLVKKAESQQLAFDTFLSPEEKELYEENQWLKKRILPKIPEAVAQPTLQQTRIVKLTAADIMQQAQILGAYLGKHVTQIFFPNRKTIAHIEPGTTEMVPVYVSMIKKIKDKSGNPMAFLALEDETSIVEAVVFSSTWSRNTIEEKKVYLVSLKKQDDNRFILQKVIE